MLGIILIAILVILIVGGLPQLGYQPYGYYPSSGLGFVVVIILVLILLGHI
jgi:hypothetical protein